MLASSAPTSFVAPFANAAGAGFIRTIPANSLIGITNGAASLHDGFPPDCFTPVAAGGVPPFGADFNGLLQQTTAGVQWSQVGGEPVYNSAFSTAIGGYPNGAILQSADGTGFWRSTADNNGTNPDTGGANWLPMFFSTSATIALSNANVTLTAAHYSKPIIVLTGTLTAAVALTFPAFVQQWTVINATTGAFAVTALTSGGAAVTLAQGGKTELRGNGTNVVVDALQVGTAIQPAQAVPLGQAQTTFAALAGLATQLFSVAPGVAGNEAVNFSQFPSGQNARGFWMQFPNGWILQILTTNVPSVGVTVTFPVTFTTQVIGMLVSINASSSAGLTGNGFIGGVPISLSQANIFTVSGSPNVTIFLLGI
jgi:hypothetical protein